MRLIEASRCGDVSFRVPSHYHFTFTNSPYYAHLHLSAIDIYPPIGERDFLSPFDGELLFYRGFREHICGFGVGRYFVRVLHMEPAVKIGEEISVGDLLGKLQWSPTFRRWTDYHAHIEVRARPEFMRARGGLKLSIGRDVVSMMRRSPRNSGLRGRVCLVERGRYLLMDPENEGPTPVPVEANGFMGFLEGGIPYYGHGGVVTNGSAMRGARVLLDGHPVACVSENSGNYLQIVPYNVAFSIGKLDLKGISLYINFKYVKIIPLRWGEEIKEGDYVEIMVKSDPSSFTQPETLTRSDV